MRFSEVCKGIRQDEGLELPRYDGQPEDAAPLVCRVRALNGIEEERVLSAARRRAKTQGVDEPRPGDPIYELAQMYETAAIACLDADSPQSDRKPFFDGGADQVRTWFGREAIVLIHEKQQAYQDRVAPTDGKLTPIDWYERIVELGGQDEKKALECWLRSRPGLQWSLARFLASQHLSSQMHKSLDGSSSEASSSSSENGSSQKPNPTA